SFGLMTVKPLVDDLLRAQPDGQIYNTITHGKSTMGAYGPVIAVEDRWAIVAYVRALQQAAGGKIEDQPEAERKKLQEEKKHEEEKKLQEQKKAEEQKKAQEQKKPQ